MKLTQHIGVIGVGNMGAGILRGILEKNLVVRDQVWVYDKIADKANLFAQQWRVRRAASNVELLRNSQIVILALKPQDLLDSANEFANTRHDGQIIVSILAGTPIAKVQQAVGQDRTVVRAMPNLGATVGEAMTALTSHDVEALNLADEIFSACGKTVRLEESYFDLVTAVSGSGPAYFFLMMELLAKEGMANGLSKEKAELLAVQTALGAAKLAASSAQAPDELRRMVTSKGGTTEAALRVLEEKGFPAIFHQALQAALARGKELSQ